MHSDSSVTIAPSPVRRALSVVLSHAPNPDIAGGYWEEIPPRRKVAVPVSSLEEASRVCVSFIRRYGLGSGNWTGGEVTEDGAPIARISYNGRCWTPYSYGHPECKEIALSFEGMP